MQRRYGPRSMKVTGSNSTRKTLPDWRDKAILLVDLDAFFASVEQLDHPAWQGRPVIVGGDPERRGVVSTASYEARGYGVHSAMPSSTAKRLCPQAIWTPGNFARYREMSAQVMAILAEETPFMQQVSIDEAFLDVTPTAHNTEHPIHIASRIKKRVKELGISCSIGVGVSKSVAKIASDAEKPDGLTVVYPGCEQGYLAPLPLRAMSGIGQAAEAKLRAYGLQTLGDVAQASPSILESVFGKNGEEMRLRCLGRDESPVAQSKEVKSVSSETSFATDISTEAEVRRAISTMAAKVCRRLRKQDLQASTFALKMRYENLKVRTAQTRIHPASDDEFQVAALLGELVPALWKPGMPLRLIGIAASGFDENEAPFLQESLFDEAGNSATTEVRARNARLIEATDRIRDRFGERAVNFGRENVVLGSTTGTAAKNPEDHLRRKSDSTDTKAR